jgi:hypothetical protein
MHLGDRNNNVVDELEAVDAAQAALSVFTRSNNRMMWAIGQGQLGSSLMMRDKQESGFCPYAGSSGFASETR